MPQQIFVNLPVKDLNKSIQFFTQLGYTFNPQFTDENATCMIVGENIFAMLLVEPYFNSFAPHKRVADATKTAEVYVAINVESREAVDALIKKAITAGGTTYKEPQDLGFMYQQGYQDLDGHIWEIFWMDPKGIPS